jgi:hypothetical protein
MIVTCKLGSAKHTVSDDFHLLRKHAIFGHLPNENPSTDHFKFCLFDFVVEVTIFVKSD